MSRLQQILNIFIARYRNELQDLLGSAIALMLLIEIVLNNVFFFRAIGLELKEKIASQ